MFASSSLSRLVIPVDNARLDNYYAALLDAQPHTSDAIDVSFSDSDVGEDGVGDVQPPAASQENEDIAEIVGELAKVLNVSMFQCYQNLTFRATFYGKESNGHCLANHFPQRTKFQLNSPTMLV